MATLNPALVTRSGARRLPRAALWLLCAAYILPGAIGRDPWRGDDIVAFGQMVAMAEGRSSWWTPTLGGVPTDAAVLPHWLGAIAIRLLSPVLDSAMAARVPFLGLLLLTLTLVWYACFHLARTENAQPLPLAFGGEASAVDYARAIADGAVLALIATLGLLQLGHETTPELVQLTAVALTLYGLAAAPFRPWLSRAAMLAGLPLLAACDAPSMALATGVGGAVVCARSAYPQVRRFAWWVAAAMFAAGAVTTMAGGWHWRAGWPSAADLLSIARQWLWFMWPTWVLGLWTLWRWRRHLTRRHMAVPLVTVAVALASNLAMSGLDRALLLGLPGLAVLAAFALPTLHRSTSAAIDWFSMSFFTVSAVAIWVIYAAMHTSVPAKTAANIAKLAPGFVAHFSFATFLLAALGTLAWLWLVRWRTGRHREAVWKSMVLPAGGVVLSWWLLMTLWLPLLDYARSWRPLVDRIAAVLPREACVAAPRADPSLVAALEFHGRWRVDARAASPGRDSGCDWLVLVSGANRPAGAPQGWQRVADLKRPTSRDEVTSVFRRSAASR